MSGAAPITPPMVDGYTRCALDWDPAMRPALLDALAAIRRPRSREERAADRERGGRFVALPIRRPDRFAGEVLAKVVQVSGDEHECVRLEVADTLEMTLNLELGTFIVTFRAKALWAQGWAAVAGLWLDEIAWMLGAGSCTLATARGVGWRVTRIELCVDFVGLTGWSDADRYNFMGIRTHAGHGKRTPETLSLGSRSDSNISACIYDKTAQIAAKRNVDIATYLAIWSSSPLWRPGIDVQRVEFRFCDDALDLVDRDTGECISFRDPAVLADPALLGKLWAHAARKIRLVDPASNRRSDRRQIDPRWEVVMKAAGCDAPNWKQERLPQRLSWQARRDAAARQAMNAARRFAAHHGRAIVEPRGYVDVFEMMLAHAAPDREVDEDYARRYVGANLAFLGPEIEGLGNADVRNFEIAIGRRLRGIARVPIVVPPPTWADGRRILLPPIDTS